MTMTMALRGSVDRGAWTGRRVRGSRWRPGPGLRLPAHRASTATLAGAYPFVVPPAMDLGVPIGVDVMTGQPFCFDPWALYDAGQLTNPNMLLAGVIGQGKSALAKSLAIRSVAAGRQVLVPGDPKGEWGVVADAVGGTTQRLGPGVPARINPLDATGSARVSVLAAVAEILLARALVPAEHAALDAAVTAVDGRSAVLADVVRQLTTPDPALAGADGTTTDRRARDARDLVHSLRRLVRGDLAGLFDAPTTVQADPDSPMIVLDSSALNGDDTALAVAMTCAATWLDTALSGQTRPGRGRRRWVIYDEGWRLLRTPTQLRRMQAQWKLARATGTANLLILHRLSDLDAIGDHGSGDRALAEGLLADCSTRVIYRQECDAVSTAAGLIGPAHADVVSNLQRGVGAWTTPGRTVVVRHLLHEDEAGVVDTDHQP